MEESTIQHSNPRTVEDIFKDYKARRAGLLRALTSEVEAFYQSCDPERENLCLYGHSNGAWEVNLPAEEIPPELPEPSLGINFARDGMQRQDWLSLVAVYSDAWILSIAYYFGARLNKTERKQLFNLINDLPTLFDIVSGRKAIQEKSSTSISSKNKGKLDQLPQARAFAKEAENEGSENDEDDDERSEATCGSCGKAYTADEFWICCDSCERWFHGKCVKITPEKAEHLKQYKCPSCTKRART